MISASQPLLLIGCGQMGTALLTGWRTAFADDRLWHIIARNPNRLSALQSQSLQAYASLDALPTTLTPSLICLAVKPDGLAELLPLITARFAASKPAILSVAAGKPIDFYASRLWTDAAIIRTMPNTPSAIGMGMSVCVANAHTTQAQHTMAHQLMEAVGKVLWLKDESQMHLCSAISGSGPAYLFAFIEAMTDAAIALGLSAEDASMLVLQTVSGSAALAEQSPHSPAQLRAEVTSPNGMTQAGLTQLMRPSSGLSSLLRVTIEAAICRSKELAT